MTNNSSKCTLCQQNPNIWLPEPYNRTNCNKFWVVWTQDQTSD